MEGAGSRLKKIRLEKGLSLEEVQKKTKVHLNILKAIEGDTFTNLSPVYLKSFSKIYCHFLGVDPKEFVPEYRAVREKVEIRSGEKAQGEKKTPSSRFFEDTTVSLKSFGEGARKYKKIFLSILFAVLVLFILFHLGRFIAKHRASHRAVEVARVTQKKVASFSVAAATLNKFSKTALSEITVTISAKENCLVTLKADGHVLFHRVLERGRSETWQAKNRIDLYLGNAGGVELIVNGQRFPSLGRRGQAIKGITITKEGLNIPR